MTSPVTPPAAPTVPLYPALGSPSFNADAYAFGSGMPGVVTDINALAQNAFANATAANESATASAANAAASEASAGTSLAGSNFRGDWAALPAGTLNKPASVAHAGRLWLLLDNLADVTAAVPGVSASWRAYDVVLPLAHVTTAAQTAVAGYNYSLEFAGATTLTLPAAPAEGAMVWITVANGRYDNTVARNGSTIMALAEDMLLDNPTTYQLRFINGSWRLL